MVVIIAVVIWRGVVAVEVLVTMAVVNGVVMAVVVWLGMVLVVRLMMWLM